jgi:hypothetical protein
MASTLFNKQTARQPIDMNDSRMQFIKQFLSSQHLTPEQAVRKICNERGIDVDSFIKSIQ